MNLRPLRISVAPNGARRSKNDHPAIAMTADEIAAEAQQCLEAGAVLLHLHVRDSAGKHSLRPDLYRRALAAIQERIGGRLLVQITTEAAGIFGVDVQMATVISVRPPAASFAIREFIPDESHESRARDFFAAVRDMGTIPQFILYEPSEVVRMRRLRESGVIPFANPPLLFVIGKHVTSAQAQRVSLLSFLSICHDEPWTVCCFGAYERLCAAAAIALGGDVRVGFENNLHRPDGSTLASNAEQVAAVAELSRSLGRAVANDMSSTITH